MNSEGTRSVQLLAKLDELLADVNVEQCTERSGELLDDPAYTEQNKEYHKITTQFEINVNFIVNKACTMLEATPTTYVFRVCSVGCGDGRMDKEILEGITQRFPERKLHYIGIDTNKLSCQRARLLLGSLKNVSVEVFSEDIQQISATVTDLEPCDLVFGVHMIYYMSLLKEALSNIVSLIKPKGQVLLVAVCREPYNELFRRFWLKEKKRHVCFSTDVMKCLDEMPGVKYTVEYAHGVNDLSQCFEDGFKHPHQRSVLDFIAQTKFERYPPLVAETCIQYLSSIAYGKPEQTLIAGRQHVIIVQR